MNSFQKGWYLLYTKPRHEKKIYVKLSQLNIRSLLPTRKRVASLAKRKKYIDEPLFPSYIFIYLNEINNYYDGLSVDGVLSYVRSEKKIVRVRESVIDNIRVLMDSSVNIEVTTGDFMKGQEMIIGNGPLKGLSCEVVEIETKSKILVRVEMLSRNILVSLPVSDTKN